MINKTKLQHAKDLQEFLSLENTMSMSWQEYKEHLKCLRLCARDARMSEDIEEHNFYVGLIKEHKNNMRKQLEWLDSAERYQMMENLAQSEFVKSIYKMRRGENNETN